MKIQFYLFVILSLNCYWAVGQNICVSPNHNKSDVKTYVTFKTGISRIDFGSVNLQNIFPYKNSSTCEIELSRTRLSSDFESFMGYQNYNNSSTFGSGTVASKFVV